MATLSGFAYRQAERSNKLLPAGTRSRGYESFVRDQGPRLVQSLSLIARDRELAADAAQDAFIQLYRHWDDMETVRDPVLAGRCRRRRVLVFHGEVRPRSKPLAPTRCASPTRQRGLISVRSNPTGRSFATISALWRSRGAEPRPKEADDSSSWVTA